MNPEARARETGIRRATVLKLLCAFVFTAALVTIPVLLPGTQGVFTASIVNSSNRVGVAPPPTCREIMANETAGVFAYQLNTGEPVNLVNSNPGTANFHGPVTASNTGASGCLRDAPGYSTFAGSAAPLSGIPGTVGYNVPLIPPKTYTQELWFKTTTTGGSLIALGRSTSYSSDLAYVDRQLYLNANGHLVMGNRITPAIFESLATSRNVADGFWHQVVAVRDVANRQNAIYLDGELLTSNITGTISDITVPGYWRIGCNDTSLWPGGVANRCFNGDIAFAAVYNRAFTQQDVINHYRAGVWRRQ